MAAVWISSQLQRQIGWRTWRALHYTAFVVYELSVAHTIGAGEDASTSWGRWIVIASISIVTAMASLRLVGRRVVSVNPSHRT